MAPAGPVSTDLRDLERRRLRSLVEVDMDTAEQLHTPDFELVNPSGSTWSRERYLGGIASGDIDYISVDGGTPGPLTAQHLDVYVRDTGGRWRVRWSQATEVADR